MTASSSEVIYFPVGTMLKPCGLKGEVRVRFQLHDVSLLEPLPPLVGTFPAGHIEKLPLRSVRPHRYLLILGFTDVHDRTAAELLRDVELSVPREALPPLEDGESDLADLSSYMVAGDQGEVISTVTDAWEMPANDVLPVLSGEREVLIPLIDSVVREIDHDKRQLIITIMEGLLD